jgi:hypothetical protein
MIDLNIIISLICSTVGIIVGIFIRKYFERKLNYDIKHDELILDNEINTLKDKLTIYWSIYFKLLICQSANMQINKINNNNSNRIIQLDNETIINNLDEIVNIISNNIQKMNVDENLLDLILQFITHVLAYKCIKQLNIKNKTPSEYGYPFPEQFTQEITSRTFKYQSIFEKYIGNKSDIINPNQNPNQNLNLNSNINLNIKEKIKKIHEQIPQNIIRLQSENSIQFDEDDLDIICDPADIDLLAIFDNNIKRDNNHIIRFNQ